MANGKEIGLKIIRAKQEMQQKETLEQIQQITQLPEVVAFHDHMIGEQADAILALSSQFNKFMAWAEMFMVVLTDDLGVTEAQLKAASEKAAKKIVEREREAVECDEQSHQCPYSCQQEQLDSKCDNYIETKECKDDVSWTRCMAAESAKSSQVNTGDSAVDVPTIHSGYLQVEGVDIVESELTVTESDSTTYVMSDEQLQEMAADGLISETTELTGDGTSQSLPEIIPSDAIMGVDMAAGEDMSTVSSPKNVVIAEHDDLRVVKEKQEIQPEDVGNLDDVLGTEAGASQ